MQSVGVAACAKHFPGHGDTVTDSHLALPRAHARGARARRARARAVPCGGRGGGRCIMTSHVVVSAIDAERPATFSPVVLGDVLRGRLGFEGVIVSDALDMAGASAETGIPEAAVRALGAGLRPALRRVRDDGGLLPRRRRGGRAGGRSRVGCLSRATRGGGGAGRPAVPGLRGRRPGCARQNRRRGGAPRASGALVGGFEVGDAVRDVARRPGEAVIVQVASDPNLAVGRVAWGPTAAGLTTTRGRRARGRQGRRGRPRARRGATRCGRSPIAFVHRDIRRSSSTAAGLAAAPDLVTFGGSVVVAQALGRYLGVPAR